MDKESFLNKLMVFTPEELNDFLEMKGKIKHVNLVTFMDEDDEKQHEKE